MSRQDNVDNYKTMLEEYNKMLQGLKDSRLKEQFKRFVYGVTSNKVPFKSIMLQLESFINESDNVSNGDTTYPSKFIIKFWKKVQKIFIDTYKESKRD